jgi:DNA-binding MarR family transcriptional regulator
MRRYPAHTHAPEGAPEVAEAAGDTVLVDSIQEVGRAVVSLTARCIEQMDLDLNLAEHRALSILIGSGPQQVGDFARELGITLPMASKFCDKLVSAHLASWCRRTGERREHRLRVSGRGRRLIGELMRMRRAAIRRILQDADVAAQPDLVTALHAFAVAAGEPGEVEWWRHWRAKGRETRRNNVAH